MPSVFLRSAVALSPAIVCCERCCAHSSSGMLVVSSVVQSSSGMLVVSDVVLSPPFVR